MKINNFSPDDLVEIIRLYEKTCGTNRSFKQVMLRGVRYANDEVENIKDSLIKKQDIEYRIGSKWNDDSRLCFIACEDTFEINIKKIEPYRLIEKAKEQFLEMATQYLNR